jgi:2-iminobutanoate/2-iminopropanoate deaminase
MRGIVRGCFIIVALLAITAAITFGQKVGKNLFLSGTGDYKPDETVEGKVKNCLTLIKGNLEKQGLSLNNVVYSFCYLEGSISYPEFNKYYAEFFPTNPPARTTFAVANDPGPSQIEITVIAHTESSEIKPVGTPPAGFPFTPAFLAGDMYYISGKGDQLPQGGHPATFEEQVRQCMKNVETALKDAGLGFQNAVMMHVILDKYENFEVANKVYSSYFKPGDEPACATIYAQWIPGDSHVEVACWATTDLNKRKVIRTASSKFGAAEGNVNASAAVQVGNMVYTSSLSGFDPKTGAFDDSLAPQIRQMFVNQLDALSQVGMGYNDIVSGTVYLRNVDDYSGLNAVYNKEFFTGGRRVRTCLQPNAETEKNGVKVRANFIAYKE